MRKPRHTRPTSGIDGELVFVDHGQRIHRCRGSRLIERQKLIVALDEERGVISFSLYATTCHDRPLLLVVDLPIRVDPMATHDWQQVPRTARHVLSGDGLLSLFRALDRLDVMQHFGVVADPNPTWSWETDVMLRRQVHLALRRAAAEFMGACARIEIAGIYG